MRIVRVRFKNLNSLAGEWEIDLAHPAFVSDGIFAITGPTGAGKTTILDAICLGLYGRTPRLGRVTRSGNEIMTRQTGDCFAEVVFETQAGRYRCHWSQHRARKRPRGELQAPKHEIADAVSGEVIEAKIRDVAHRVETTTGMDFNRFTRSMLLAQGGFAAFLQAPPDERAPVLEQITGTEIYSRISVRVHERRSEERKRLDTLQAELAGMQLLSPEDEQRLSAELEGKNRQDAELTRRIAEKNQAIEWVKTLVRLEHELKELDRAKAGLQARLEVFAPQQERLALANRALEIAADHAALAAIRREQEADGRALRQCEKSLAGLDAVVERAEKEEKAAAEQFEARKVEEQEAQPRIRQVRELDLNIAEMEALIEVLEGSVGELSAAFAALGKNQQGDSDELLRKREALAKLQASLAATRADGELVEQLTGLRGRFDALKALNCQLAEKEQEAARAEHQLCEAANAWREQMAGLEKERRNRIAIEAAVAEKEARLREILEHRDRAEWRQIQSELAIRKELIAKALEAVQARSESRQAAVELDQRRTGLKREAAHLRGALSVQCEKQAALEKERDLLTTQLILLMKIEGFQEARSRLRDGEPCPLCGATEHPFARGNIPAPDETREGLKAVEANLKSVAADISRLKVRQAQVNKDREHAASVRAEHAAKIDKAGEVIGEICLQLALEPELAVSDPMLEAKLKGLQEKNAHRLEQVNAVLEAAEATGKELNTVRESLAKAKDGVARAERVAQSAAHQKESAAERLERLTGEANGYREQRREALDRLGGEVRVFGVETLSLDSLDEALDELTIRRDRWVAARRKEIELGQERVELETRIHHQARRLQQMESDLKKQEDRLAVLRGERDSLVRERRELFGDRKADDEQARLAAAVESAGKGLDEARQRATAANRQLVQLQAKMNELKKAMGARDLELKTADGAFRARLQELGFSNEKEYQSAYLPKSERKALAQQSRELADEETAIASKKREKAGLLEAERRRELTGEPLDELEKALMALLGRQKDLHQKIGATRQKLIDNERLKQQQRQRVQAVETQQRECSRWDLLHQLIGSADGKKYRNFAQGLTFEMMIRHANRQLRKMTDRYLLVRDENQPLELNVIDSYQAGEVRSTKNLSGGESFIVSLSLALGLSQMASMNVRVDSLFLDEGFGTLDDEALDTALETLAGLQQDGKLIGVISHVPALRQRIGSRIEVTPQTGGRSRIAGPGCRECR